ncbi:Cell division cycle protein 27 B [Orobanche gracilis]
MEAILTNCVRNSQQHLMHRNAIFTCERLCAEFPSEQIHHDVYDFWLG